MSATTTDTEIRAYVEAVGAALADLPTVDRDELLEDLEEHLGEVAAEGEGALPDRLGPPEDYAEELRSSAGLPSRDDTRDIARRARLRRALTGSPPWRLVRTGLDSRALHEIRAFVPELRPGWWVLRGYVLVAALAIVYATNTEADIPLPRAFGSHALGALAVAAAIWASVALGRRAEHGRSRYLTLAVNGVVLVLGASALFQVRAEAGTLNHAGIHPVTFGDPYLEHPDGSPITNICPYDSDGTALHGILLFDQDGRPITSVADDLRDGDVQDDPLMPSDGLERADGNAYPRERWVQSYGDREWRKLECPRVLVSDTATADGDESGDTPINEPPREAEPPVAPE